MTQVKMKDLKVGDVVSLTPYPKPFMSAVVSGIDETQIYFFRPYAHHDNDPLKGYYEVRLICYTGVETWSSYKDSPSPIWKYSDY